MPNGANGTMYELNSPTQSISRSPPVLAIRTSSPAPPNARSSYDGCVSGTSFSQPFVDRSSSMFTRSLPQPPHSESFGSEASAGSFVLVPPMSQSLPRWLPGAFLLFPPRSQSLPRSPKIESFPSLNFVDVCKHVPLGANESQPG